MVSLADLKGFTGTLLDPQQCARSVDDAVIMGLHYILQHLDWDICKDPICDLQLSIQHHHHRNYVRLQSTGNRHGKITADLSPINTTCIIHCQLHCLAKRITHVPDKSYPLTQHCQWICICCSVWPVIYFIWYSMLEKLKQITTPELTHS